MISQPQVSRASGQAAVTWTLAGAAGAWLLLSGLPFSPLRTSLHRHGLGGGGDQLAFLGAWLLMVGAMMLPASLDFVRTVRRLVCDRPDAGVLLAAAIGGFALVWLVVGQLFQVGDLGLHRLVAAWPWLDQRHYLITAAALGIAGAYQFSPLKHRCLSMCRSPAGFVARGWHGSYPGRELVRIGTAYGASCAGCCWALMLVMFASGLASLWLMAGLTVVMVAERRLRRVDLFTPAVAAAFILAAVLVASGALPAFLGN